jgi:6-pyruvoyl tetrahydropterin synthase/QueD family protein
MAFTLSLKKENFKFSSAHFTIFDATSAECLHGHNYRVGVHLTSRTDLLENEMVCDFNTIKKIVRKTCDTLDEKILIPLNSSFLAIADSKEFEDHIHVQYANKHYLFPNSDVVKMDTTNITSEALAYFIWSTIRPKIPDGFSRMAVSVEETRGQQASYSSNL